MRAKILLLLAATLVMAARASAVTITRGPIIENPDAVTSMITIAWWTDTAGDSTVDYGVNSAALLFSNTVPQAGSCEIGAAGTCHIVTLSGLLPGTRYYYRLKVGGVIVQNTGSSGPYFTTLKDPTDTTDLFFTIIGDWGQASGHEQSVSNLQDAADPQMIVTVGDNAYQNGAQSDWDNNALAYYVNPMKRVTFFPTLGNHDLNSVGASSWASSVEIKMFARRRRRALHRARRQRAHQRHPTCLARQRPGNHHPQVEVRLPAPDAVLVRQRDRVDRQRLERACPVGTALRVLRRRHRLRRARPHL